MEREFVRTESCIDAESDVCEVDANKEGKVLITEGGIGGESDVCEVDMNKEGELIAESCIENESDACDADTHKGEKLSITESCKGDESGLCELDMNQEPREGMLFESVQAAKAFYDEYARRVGFLTRIVSSRKSDLDGSIIHRRLACNKEGFNLNSQKSVRVRKRESKREGCMARLVVKKEKSGKWVISKFVKEHSHTLFVTSENNQSNLDDKDQKIQELSSELERANEELAACREQLFTFMTYIEEHANRLSETVESAVQIIREMESRDHSHHL